MHDDEEEPTKEEIKAALQDARDLLARSGWVQGAYALSPSGVPVHPADETAVGFCALGAIMRVTGEAINLRGDCIHSLERLTNMRISMWNDRASTTKEEVLALYDRAISQTDWVGS